MPQKLRILTGLHCGAEIELGHVEFSIGKHDNCDIRITDWDGDDIAIRCVTDEDAEVCQWRSGAQDAWSTLEPLAPRIWGTVALVFGPADQAWPSDLELLQTSMRGKPEAPAHYEPPRTKGRRNYIAAIGGVLMTATLCAYALMHTAQSSGVATRRVTPESAVELVRQILEQQKLTDVTVNTKGDKAAVTGWVDTQEQLRRLRAAMQKMGVMDVVAMRVVSTPDLAESLLSGVALPGATAISKGHGVLLFKGRTTDSAATRSAVARVAKDLAPDLTAVEFDLEEISKPKQAVPYTSAQIAGTDSVVQTRDGIRHVVVHDGLPEKRLSQKSK